MPNVKVKISEQKVGSVALPMPNISADAFGASIGRALSNVGDTIGNIQDKKRRKDIENENLLISKTDAESDAYWARKLAEDKVASEAGAPEFSQIKEEEFAEYREKILSSMPTDRARAKMDVNLERLYGHVSADSYKFEAGKRIEKKKTDLGVVVSERRNSVMNNPARYKELLAQSLEDVAGANLQGNDAVEQMVMVQNGMAQSAAQGIIERNPSGGLKMLNEGYFDGEMKPETKAVLINQAQAAIKQQQTIQRQASTEARYAISSIKERMTSGDSVPAEELAYVKQVVDASGNPQLSGQFGMLQQTQSFTQVYSKMSPQELQREVINLRANVAEKGDGITAEQFNQLDIAEKTLQKMATAVSQDRMAYASKAGITDIGSIVNEDGAITKEGALKRISASDTLDEHFGFKGDILTKTEEDLIVRTMNSGSVEDQMAYASNLVSSFGDRSMDVFSQINAKDPSIAYIGGLAVDNPEVARRALEGRKIKRDNPKAVDMGAGVESEITEVVRDTLKDTLRFNPKHENAVRNAAMDIYRYDAYRSGESDGSFDDDMYREALEAAVDGKILRIGADDTIVPKNVSEDEFNEILTTATTESLISHSVTGEPPVYANGNPVSPDELKESKFYPVYDGQYAIKGPNGFWMAGKEMYIFDVRGSDDVGQP